MSTMMMRAVPAFEQQMARPFPSRWIASVLPHAEAACRAAPAFIEAVDDAVGLDNFKSVMDAVCAAVFPELRLPMDRFYAAEGPSMAAAFNVAQVARFDERLTLFARAVRELPTERIAIALAVLRAG